MKEEIEEIKQDNVSELRKIAEKTFYDTFKVVILMKTLKNFLKKTIMKRSYYQKSNIINHFTISIRSMMRLLVI